MVLNPNIGIIDIAMNSVTVIIFCIVTIQLGRKWLSDKDPMSAALFAAIGMQFGGLLAEVISEVLVFIGGLDPIAEVFSYIFFILLIGGYAPLAYFYTGLFRPRNRWFVSAVSFLGGFSIASVLREPILYGIPDIMILPLGILTLSVIIPITYSCFKTAPKAPRKVTKMKFRLVGGYGLMYLLTFSLLGAAGQFHGNPLIGSIIFASTALMMIVTVILAWFGWAMPAFLRKRWTEATIDSS